MPEKRPRSGMLSSILLFGWPRKWRGISHCTELVASNHLNATQTKPKSAAKKSQKPIGMAESNSPRWQPQNDELCFWGRLSNQGPPYIYICVSYFSNLILSRINFDIRMIMALESFLRLFPGCPWLLHFGEVDEINIRQKLQAHSMPPYRWQAIDRQTPCWVHDWGRTNGRWRGMVIYGFPSVSG